MGKVKLVMRTQKYGDLCIGVVDKTLVMHEVTIVTSPCSIIVFNKALDEGIYKITVDHNFSKGIKKIYPGVVFSTSVFIKTKDVGQGEIIRGIMHEEEYPTLE